MVMSRRIASGRSVRTASSATPARSATRTEKPAFSSACANTCRTTRWSSTINTLPLCAGMVGSFRCIGRSGPARYRAALRDAPGQFLERPLDEVEFHLDLAGAMELDFVGLFEALNRLTQGVEDDVALVEDVDNRVVFRACDV